MSQQNHKADKKSDKKLQSNAGRMVGTEVEDTFEMRGGDISQVQAARLSDPRIPLVHRHKMVNRMGEMQGNRHTTRMVGENGYQGNTQVSNKRSIQRWAGMTSPDAPMSVAVPTNADEEREQSQTNADTNLVNENVPSQSESEIETEALDVFWKAILRRIGFEAITSPWPYYYRALADHDPTIAQISSGADLLPRSLQPGRIAKLPASQAEMTFRHTRSGGNALNIGTDRISAAGRIDPLIEFIGSRGTGEIARIDPEIVKQEGVLFLDYHQVRKDLTSYELQTRNLLRIAENQRRGTNYINRIKCRLQAIIKAQDMVARYLEGHGVVRIPASAVTGVRFPKLERWGPPSLRGLGWLLTGISFYLTYDRIQSASPEEGQQIFMAEMGSWIGSIIDPTGGIIGGAYGEYAVETAIQGPRPMTLAFPTGYTWAIDAVIGKELAEQDPEGANLVRKAYTEPEAAINFWRRLAMPY